MVSEILSGKSLKHSGNGIGLLSAQEYFNNLKGKLELESTLNIGTILRITFPVADKPAWFINHIQDL